MCDSRIIVLVGSYRYVYVLFAEGGGVVDSCIALSVKLLRWLAWTTRSLLKLPVLSSFAFRSPQQVAGLSHRQ